MTKCILWDLVRFQFPKKKNYKSRMTKRILWDLVRFQLKKKLQVQGVKYVRTTFAYEFVYIEKKNNNFTGKSFAMLSPPVNSKRS